MRHLSWTWLNKRGVAVRAVAAMTVIGESTQRRNAGELDRFGRVP